MIGDLDWKLAWQGIGTLRPKTLDISTWDKGPDRIKKVFSIFDSTLCENNTDMEYMKRTLAQVTLKVKWLIFIGPESDHWKCLSVTHSLTAV